MDGDVIGTVSCEAVDFVHYAVRDPVGFHVLDHALQGRPVSLLRGLTRINELFNDDRPKLGGFVQIRVPLRRD
ncbi:hypothetical protein GCM10009861_18430 [Neomicrococcus aestuarii]|nr:hypothetical protein [Neomicrococcus lactis]